MVKIEWSKLTAVGNSKWVKTVEMDYKFLDADAIFFPLKVGTYLSSKKEFNEVAGF